MKRFRTLVIRLNDDEHAILDRLQKTYNDSGVPASKSFLVRHALKCFPFQSEFFKSVAI